jgi:hypothetical protein
MKLADDNLFCVGCGAAVAGAFSEPEKFSASPPEPQKINTVTDLPSTVVDLPSNVVDMTSNVVDLPVQSNTSKNAPKNSEVTVKPEDLSKSSKPKKEKSSAKPPLSKGKRVLIAIASVLSSIVLFASVTTGQSWFIMKNGVNNQTVKAMARAAFDDIPFTEVPLSDIPVAGVDLPGEGVYLHEAIFDTIDEYYVDTFGVEEDHIKELLEHDVLRNFLGDIIDGGIDYIMGGEDTAIMTSDKVVSLIHDNADEIGEITGYQLVDTDFEDISNVLKQGGLDDLTWSSAGIVSGEVSAVRKILSIFESSPILVLSGIIAVIAVFTVLLFLLNRRRASNALVYFGVPCLISGLAVTVSSFFVNVLFRHIAGELGLSSPAVLQDAFSGAGGVILYCGLTVTGIGAVAVVVKIIIKSLNKKISTV